LSPIINVYNFWYSKSCKDVSLEEIENVINDDFSEGFCLNPFSRVVEGYYQVFYTSYYFGEGS
jgi:hypothetical protein